MKACKKWISVRTLQIHALTHLHCPCHSFLQCKYLLLTFNSSSLPPTVKLKLEGLSYVLFLMQLELNSFKLHIKLLTMGLYLADYLIFPVQARLERSQLLSLYMEGSS